MSKRIDELTAQAARAGLWLRTWNPGDGTRYRLFAAEPADGFHSEGGIATLLRSSECAAFVAGYRYAMERMIALDEQTHGPIPSFLRRPT